MSSSVPKVKAIEATCAPRAIDDTSTSLANEARENEIRSSPKVSESAAQSLPKQEARKSSIAPP
ncbi:hypothetical protein D3C76_1795930 [compost metagenome]